MRKIIPLRLAEVPECTPEEKATIKMLLKNSSVNVHNQVRHDLAYENALLHWKQAHRVSMRRFVALYDTDIINGIEVQCLPAGEYDCTDSKCCFSEKSDFDHCPACNRYNRIDGKNVRFEVVEE